MVYVISKNGQPLMPTENHAKVRILLKTGKAKVLNRCPFTIQLLYDSTNHTQEISLGIDTGSKHIGFSTTTKNKVLYESDVELRTDIVELLSSRRELRRTRRYNKTRYREPGFNDNKHKGWLAPSIKHKIETHLTETKKITKILPVSKITAEVASFDIQKIKNPDIKGVEYQQGEQMRFWNVREYVLWRDNYTCQYCKGKSGCKILNVHHKESRKTGGNSPGNLITLCEYCHDLFHRGLITLSEDLLKRTPSYRDAAFMGIMRWAFYEKLKELYPKVSLTYGYITKNTRISNNLPKEHIIDARCISGNPLAKSDGIVYFKKKVRCHNRQIHKCKILKGGVKKRNQAPYDVKGFKLYDTVSYKNKEYIIFGRRTSGFFDIRTLDGEKVNKGSVSCKKLKFIRHNSNFIIEIRKLAI